MNSSHYVVIMAGGSGTRLWPLSRHNRPKQILAFKGVRNLFQLAVDRLEEVVARDHIYVVTVADQARQLQASIPEIPEENYLIEPLPRGTASVVGLAAIALEARDPNASMAVVTADHLIENTDRFKALLTAGFHIAEDGYLVTLGITPTAPITGFGYIERGEQLGEFDGCPYYRVVRFKEKPDPETAEKFLRSGDHYWNSGMFVWTVERILQEFASSMPELSNRLTAIAHAWHTTERSSVLQANWEAIKPETIDYGIMERAHRVAVLTASDLQWSDVGSWESLFDAMPGDENDNVILAANHLGVDTSSTLVLGDNKDRIIVTIGVSDLVLVDTGDALLVCKRSESQKVREVVKMLEKTKRNNYL